MATNESEKPAFAEWAIVEVMGRLKLAGKVTEAVLFGAAMCRVDVYPGDAAEPAMTRMFGGGSLYSVTLVSEATARAFAQQTVPEPVARWEMPALQAAQQAKAARSTMGVHPDVDDDEEQGWRDADAMEDEHKVDASYDQPSYR